MTIPLYRDYIMSTGYGRRLKMFRPARRKWKAAVIGKTPQVRRTTVRAQLTWDTEIVTADKNLTFRTKDLIECCRFIGLIDAPQTGTKTGDQGALPGLISKKQDFSGSRRACAY